MNAYLRLLSLFLPVQRRDTWLSEWNAELWHVRSECGWGPALHLLRGALADAREIRVLAEKESPVGWSGIVSGILPHMLRRIWTQSWTLDPRPNPRFFQPD